MAKKTSKETPAPADPTTPEATGVVESADLENLTPETVSAWIRAAHLAIPTLPDPDNC